jgi:acid phosphatase
MASWSLITLIAISFFVVDALAALSFSVHGDWGVPITWSNTMATCSEKHNSQFILGIGDNFYGKLTHGYHGVKSTTDPKWKTIFEDVYKHKFFSKPWYIIAGNHDHESSVAAQIAYRNLSPRWKFPSRYYVVHKKVGQSKVDIFMLDTTPLSSNDASLQHEFGLKFDNAQVKWLGRELKRSKAKWKIVVGHHPIYKAQKGGNFQLGKYINPLLEKYKVAAYIAGHMHNMQHVQSPKLHYIIIGNGAIQVPVDDVESSKKLRKRFIFPTETQFKTICTGGACRGFGLFTIKNSKEMVVHYYDSTGKLRKSVKMMNPN